MRTHVSIGGVLYKVQLPLMPDKRDSRIPDKRDSRIPDNYSSLGFGRFVNPNGSDHDAPVVELCCTSAYYFAIAR